MIFFFVFLSAPRSDQIGGRNRPQDAGAGVLKPGDKIVAVDGKGYPALDPEDRVERFREQIGAHKCAGKQVDGCLAEDAGRADDRT